MSVPLTVTASSAQHMPESSNKQTSAALPIATGDSLLVQLQNAISNGDEEQAQNLALLLAKQKTKISISTETQQPQTDKVVR